MKAFELQNGFGIDNVALVERDHPKPGPGQILIRMRAWSLNFRELLVIRGHYLPNLKFPLQLLSDGAGEVAEVGPGVSRVKTGDRVANIFMQKWIEGGVDQQKARSAVGGDAQGVAAEYVVLDETGVVRIPDHLSFAEAATLPCAALTAWNALVTAGNLKPGDTILVQGTGGVSIFALQFAKLSGARVIATSSSDEKLARVREIGADETINYKTTADWGVKARELTGGIGVDHVVDVGGAGTMPQSMQAVRPGGRISLIGILAPGRFDPVPILMKAITVQGIFVGSRAMFEDMNRAIALHKLKPVISERFAFTDLPKALRHMESQGHFGKIVLETSPIP